MAVLLGDDYQCVNMQRGSQRNGFSRTIGQLSITSQPGWLAVAILTQLEPDCGLQGL